MSASSASALATDLYQLTMLAAYVCSGRTSVHATFELFARRLPAQRSYLVAAGLELALDYIEHLRFAADEIEWLRSVPAMSHLPEDVWDYLRTFRFTGDVWAIPEGTPFFANEPVLRVTAPLPEAQLLETALLGIINFQTSIASKASRVVTAAGGRPVVEFGARRAHGLDAALWAARSAYLAGCAGTSLVEAGRRFGLPVSGTMAHSFVMASEGELQAFRTYGELFGGHTVLLIDTYDTVAAARRIVEAGLRPPAVRLDSGDLLALSRDVRRIFDAAGLEKTRILASGDLDEWKIARLLDAGAPIDAFGVGTAMATSDDAPALGGVYKLVEIEEGGRMKPVMKRSEGKATIPGRKQVWRSFHSGVAQHDVIGLATETLPGTPLLECVISNGQITGSRRRLEESRDRCIRERAKLPSSLHTLDGQAPYSVTLSPGLQSLLQSD